MNDVSVVAVLALVLLLLCSGVFAIIFNRLRFPYTIGLVLVGLGLGAMANHVEGMAFVSKLHFTPNIVLYILLPTLVFDAALNLDSRLLIKNLLPIFLLAAPGLVFSTLITGALMSRFTPLTLGAAMLFGALISTTDPVAVISVFKELGAPKRLTMLVDGESLFNDATAIVMFNILLSMLAGGALLGLKSAAGAGLSFLWVFFGGALVGALVGYVIVRILALAQNDPLVEIAFTAVIAYVAFILAQFYLDLSGVMAVVGAGLVVSYYSSTRFTVSVKEQLDHFWSFACFAANSYIFLLLGLTEGYIVHNAHRLARVGLFVMIAIAVVTFTRALLIYGFVPLINRVSRQHSISRSYQTIMFWGGLRGALPLALAMSLSPEQVGGEINRMLILDCTLGVVLFTLLIQGVSIKRLMSRLGLDNLTQLEKTLLRHTGLIVKKAGLNMVDAIAAEWPDLEGSSIEKVRREYDSSVSALNTPAADERIYLSKIGAGVLWVMMLNDMSAIWRQLFEERFLKDHSLREFEHYLDFCREDIMQGVVPPGNRYQPGIEQRTLKALFVILRALTPSASWTRRVNQVLLEEVYFTNMAITFACGRALKNLPHLRQLSGASNDAVESCALWLKVWNKSAAEEVARVKNEDDVLAVRLQETTVRRLALETEQKKLDEVVEKGGISDKLAIRLKSNFE